jgi:hypothetical protein
MLDIDGTAFQMQVPVMRREAQLPYGYVMRELEILPVVGVGDHAGGVVVPSDGAAHTVDVQVDAVTYSGVGATGAVRLDVPQDGQPRQRHKLLH